jgi:hypothetical protein
VPGLFHIRVAGNFSITDSTTVDPDCQASDDPLALV